MFRTRLDLFHRLVAPALTALCCLAACESVPAESVRLATPEVRLQGTPSRNAFTAEWEAVEGAQYYAYRVGGVGSNPVTGRTDEPQKRIASLEAGKRYTFEVMAVAEAGSGVLNSEWSAALEITTAGGAATGGDGIGTGETGAPSTNPADYTLVWADEFESGTVPDPESWNIEINGNGGGNNELQYYRAENVAVGREPATGRGCLMLTARREEFGGRHATSGRITTKNKRYFRYGRFDASIKLPKTANGLWPAYWMMGNDFDEVGWPRCGEIDILEMGHSNGIAAGTQERYLNGACHWGYYKNNAYPNYANSVTYPYSVQDGEFHLFTCLWNHNRLAMYIDLDKYPDAQPYFQMDINGYDDDWSPGYYFNKECFILFNLAVGGNFPGIWNIDGITALADGERTMYVDYIRVYRRNQ